jgi:hypothetical protein
MPSNKACPAPDCRAANPPQRDVSADLALHGETAEWARSAMVCGYCGCVHTGHGNERRNSGDQGSPGSRSASWSAWRWPSGVILRSDPNAILWPANPSLAAAAAIMAVRIDGVSG